MEEMNQNNEEEVIEQRPSTKYGRTAYQQQMQEEQETAQQNKQEQNPYQQYTPYEEPKKEVKNIFAYVAMALVGVSTIVSFILFVMTGNGYTYAESLDDLYVVIEQVIMTPGYTVLSYLADVLFWITVVFIVLDIVQLYKANCKITGAILFAIFLRPAYFIWRAHLLKKKKIVPILYTVGCYLISFAGVCVVMAQAMELVMRITA